MDQSMVVTCDHCGTRYKLDSSRIPGRGARVTCPSCRHVFVVYRKESSATVAPTPSPSRASIESEAARLDPDALNFRDVGIMSWKVKVKIGLVYDFNDLKTIRKNLRERRITSADLISYNSKDWVPIGTISELERHFCEVFVRLRREQEDDEEDDAPIPEDAPTAIMEGGPAQLSSPKALVSPRPAAAVAAVAAPVVSVPVGGASEEIVDFEEKDDLDEEFSEEFDEKFDEDELSAAFSAAEAEVDQSVVTNGNGAASAPRFVDPFESRGRDRASDAARSSRDRTSRERPSKRGADSAPSRSNAGLYMLVLVALVLTGAGVWYYVYGPGSVPTQIPNTPSPSNIDENEEEEIRHKLMEDLHLDEPLEREALSGVEEVRFPVRPKNVPNAQTSSVPGLNGGSFSVDRSSGRAGLVAADNAAKRGDWGSAVRGYEVALAKEPNNSQILERLGEALYESGDANRARTILTRAQANGSTRADKWLGHIAFDSGDESSASTHYQRYLRTNPPDNAEIQRRLASLNGGG